MQNATDLYIIFFNLQVIIMILWKIVLSLRRI